MRDVHTNSNQRSFSWKNSAADEFDTRICVSEGILNRHKKHIKETAAKIFILLLKIYNQLARANLLP